MSTEAFKSEQAGLAEKQAMLEPFVDSLRVILGPSSPNDLQLAQMRDNAVTGKANFELVAGFVEHLPQATYYYGSGSPMSIATEGPVMASRVQEHLLWQREAKMVNNPTRRGKYLSRDENPSYIVGHSGDATERRRRNTTAASHLLTASARGALTYGHGLRVVTVWDDEFELARKYATVPQAAGFSTAELGVTADEWSGEIRVTAGRGTMITDPNIGRRLPRPPLLPRDAVKRVVVKGIQAHIQELPREGRVSNHDMRTFDVVNTLGNLAVAFDKADELADLLDARVQAGPAA